MDSFALVSAHSSVYWETAEMQIPDNNTDGFFFLLRNMFNF